MLNRATIDDARGVLTKHCLQVDEAVRRALKQTANETCKGATAPWIARIADRTAEGFARCSYPGSEKCGLVS